MKRIVFFVFVLSSFFAQAQTLNPTGYNGTGTKNYWNGIAIYGSLHVPVGNTPVLPAGAWKASGALYYDSTGADKGFYVKDGAVFVRYATASELADSIAAVRAAIGTGGSPALDTAYLSSLYYRQGIMNNLLAGKANTVHSHAIADVTNLQTSLDAKYNASNPAGYVNAAAAAAAAPVQSVAGKTGAVSLVKADVGLSNVDNTSDVNKPVSTATQTALNGKANTSHAHIIGDVTSLQAALDSKLSNITGLVTPGTNVSFTGAGTTASPYVINAVGGVAGEVNTASNLGGGLAAYDSKSGTDLRFNSFAAADFNLASNVISIDYANGQTANSTTKGFLSFTDWINFNSKANGTHSHAISDVTNLTTQLAGKEPTIPTGTSLQYIRGDKTLATFPAYTTPTIDVVLQAGSGVTANRFIDIGSTYAFGVRDLADGLETFFQRDGVDYGMVLGSNGKLVIQASDSVEVRAGLLTQTIEIDNGFLLKPGHSSSDITAFTKNGNIYYNTTTNKLRALENGVYKDMIPAAASTPTLDQILTASKNVSGVSFITGTNNINFGNNPFYITGGPGGGNNNLSFYPDGDIYLGADEGLLHLYGANGVELDNAITGDILMGANKRLRFGSATADLASPVNGTAYYNSALGKFRAYENGSWKDMIPTVGAGGEVNTGSNLGGGLANYDSKSGTDLRFNSFAAADFNLASNVISIDYANGQTANSTTKGFLSFTDWINFNSKANGTHSHAIADVTSLQTSLDAKQATITPGTTGDYYRGDKTMQPLNKAAVGLANVDNTSDVNKPVSTATQSQLDAKANLPAANGIIVLTSAVATTNRAVAGTTNRVVVTNGDGVAGNPTIDIGSDVATIAGTQTLTNKTISGASNTLTNIPQSAVTNLTTDLANKLSNITGLVTPGTNVTMSGAGTTASPYVINASGSGGSSDYTYTTPVSITAAGATTTVGTYATGGVGETGTLSIFFIGNTGNAGMNGHKIITYFRNQSGVITITSQHDIVPTYSSAGHSWFAEASGADILIKVTTTGTTGSSFSPALRVKVKYHFLRDNVDLGG